MPSGRTSGRKSMILDARASLARPKNDGTTHDGQLYGSTNGLLCSHTFAYVEPSRGVGRGKLPDRWRSRSDHGTDDQQTQTEPSERIRLPGRPDANRRRGPMPAPVLYAILSTESWTTPSSTRLGRLRSNRDQRLPPRLGTLGQLPSQVADRAQKPAQSGISSASRVCPWYILLDTVSPSSIVPRRLRITASYLGLGLILGANAMQKRLSTGNAAGGAVVRYGGWNREAGLIFRV